MAVRSERDEKRWKHRLAVAGDDGFPRYVHLAAIRAIQVALPEGSRLKYENADALLDSMKREWDVRLHKNQFGRFEEGPVLRPAEVLADLW